MTDRRRTALVWRARFLVVPLAAIVVLTGCVGIPRSGSVQAGGTVDTSGSDIDVNFVAQGPSAGATQEQILNGFVDAAASPQNNYEIAREFLTPSVRGDWNPDAGVTIDQPGARTYTTTGDRSAQFAVTPVAEVDARGEYKESANSAQLRYDFTFEQVKGEWRISKAPPGIVLESSAFSDVFAAYSLSFFDPSFSRIVPDQRWFPSRASTATRIVSALLDGPSEWLKGAVATAFPEGSALTSDAVPVDVGQAKVDLTRPALQADAVTLQRMQLQLTTSLVQLSGSVSGVAAVSSVAVTIDGNSTAPIQPLVLTPPRVDSRPLVLQGAAFGFLSGDSIEQVPGISPAVIAAGATSAVLSADHRRAAIGSAAGVTVIDAGADPVLVDARPGLIAPAMDPYGFTWTVPSGSPGALVAHDDTGAATPIATSWPEASSIESLQVSREGTRVVALIRSGSQLRLVAAAIIRGDRNVPTKLGEPNDLKVMAGEPVSVTWVDDLTVAVLVDEPNGDTRMVSQQVGGKSTPVTALNGVVGLVGGNGPNQLRALTSDGKIMVPRGSAWQVAGQGVAFIATQMGSTD